MKMVVIDKDIVVNLNKQYFLLHILPYEKYIIRDFSWNFGILEGYEDVLIFVNSDIYFAEWVDANLVLHEVVDYDKLARELLKLLPQHNQTHPTH